MSGFYYILDELGNPVEVEDCFVFSTWMVEHKNQRQVGYTQLDDFEISTVFLGIDHNFGIYPFFDIIMGEGEGEGEEWKGSQVPVLFETMVFSRVAFHKIGRKNFPKECDCVRYCTRDEALKGHKLMVQKIVRGNLEFLQESE